MVIGFSQSGWASNFVRSPRTKLLLLIFSTRIVKNQISTYLQFLSYTQPFQFGSSPIRSDGPPSLPAMFNKFWGSQEQPRQDDAAAAGSSQQSWYPPSVGSPSPRPLTPSRTSSTPNLSSRVGSPVSPAEAAGVIASLKDKSPDELRKLLSDKDAYHQFFLSLEQVKLQNSLKEELRKETLQLARENMEKEPRMVELRNQCRIIRTMELAAAQERLNELERQKEETLKSCAPSSLIQRLQEAMNKTEEESEDLHRQLLNGETDIGTFVPKYKKLRNTYHQRALVHLAAKTSPMG